MYIGSNEQFAAPSAQKVRLERLLDGIDAGNGTPAADSIISALKVDWRLSGGFGRQEIDRSDADLLHFATEFLTTISCPQAAMVLPFGTTLKTRKLGDIRIGEEAWLLDAGRPGLHPMETTRRDAHGPNLGLLHRHIHRLTRKLACRHLGLPQAKQVCDNDDRHLLHFTPQAEAGDVVLQRWADGTDAPLFCAALPAQIEALAVDIVKDMRAFWKRRGEIARQSIEVKAIAEQRVARSEAVVEAIIFDFSAQSDETYFDFYVLYKGIDVAMRRGTILEYIPASRRAHSHMLRGPAGIDDRYEELRVLQNLGANGRITEAAAAILDSGLVNREAALAGLSTTYDWNTAILETGRPTYVTFFWQDGTINADVSMPGRMNWYRGKLELVGQLPEIVLTAMAGRPASDLADLPFGGDLIVERAEELKGGVLLHIQQRNLLINLETGKVWEEPEDPD